MDAGQIRTAVLEIVKSIAPECDADRIKSDQPLRQQVDLDSMDWLNVVLGLHARLHVDIPESDYGRLTTLDAIVACVASKLAEDAVPRGPSQGHPSELPHSHRLFDGSQVTVRPIRAEDRVMEAEFTRHLSGESRYKRFMTSVAELPESKLKYLTDVDYVHHVALVATVVREGKEVEVGVARYVVDPGGTGCEFAIVVDDAWQGSGIAGILMADLMNAARARGLTDMEGIVLGTNHRMLKFARQLGFALHREVDDWQVVHVTRKL
jgi:acetyltransferase